jgi:UDP-N-acetylglucosamine transferase subunit ALG13
MIFVTVGTDGPFDRLIEAMDAWAGAQPRTEIIAQIGHSNLKPRNMKWHHFLEPPQFREYFSSAELIVAHAGMGTILSALRFEKPLLVMPRRASLGEQRNEHQLATAKRLLELDKVNVAFDESELIVNLSNFKALQPRAKTGPYAEPRLISALRDFIHSTS